MIILASLGVVLAQTTLVRFLSIETIAPDLVLIWIVYLAITEGQSTSTTAGFVLGLLLDLLSGRDGMLGLAALTGTTAGFLAGYFYNENRITTTLGGYQFLLIVGVTSIIHASLYFLILLQGTDVGLAGTVFSYGLPTTLYTTAIAAVPMFVFSRKYASTV
jgi:rod shape-determining protein MreD